MQNIKLRELFYIFLRIGGFTFGGGYAMLPLIEKELVDEKKYLTDQEYLDILAVVQGIPGVIAINSSLFIGYKLRGVAGALSAVAGISLPSVIIITLIANPLVAMQNNPLITHIFKGIRACVVVLIFWAGFRMGKKAIINYTSLLYTFGMIIGMLFLEVHPIILIALAGVIGILTNRKVKEKEYDTNN